MRTAEVVEYNGAAIGQKWMIVVRDPAFEDRSCRYMRNNGTIWGWMDDTGCLDSGGEYFNSKVEAEVVVRKYMGCTACQEIHLSAAVSGTGKSIYSLDAEYYRDKFLALVKWMEAREAFYNVEACDALDRGFNAVGKQNLASLNATKSARMWIRNHVLMPEKGSE